MRYVRKHLRSLFPTLLTQSAFNRRLRRLWGAFILIQDAVAAALKDASKNCKRSCNALRFSGGPAPRARRLRI
jgi:hypothetical protein